MKKLLCALALAFIAFSLFPFQAFASITQPDSITIYSAKVERNLIATGDVAVFFYGALTYASYPTAATATESIIFRLYSTDGLTVLANATPYTYSAFDTNGYGQFVSGFYFPTGGGLVWGQPYVINVIGSPAFFDTFTPANHTLASSEYASASTQAEGQNDLTDYILSTCSSMERFYTSITLHGSTDTSIVLTGAGESYFRLAMPGIQYMCPQIFLDQIYTPDGNAVNYSGNLTDQYGNRLAGTSIQSWFDTQGARFGTSGGVVMGAPFFLVAIGAVVWTSRQGLGTEPGVLVAGLVMTCGALLLGNTMLVVRFIMAFIAAMMLLWAYFGRKS